MRPTIPLGATSSVAEAPIFPAMDDDDRLGELELGVVFPTFERALADPVALRHFHGRQSRVDFG
jgi:hypothetical protein